MNTCSDHKETLLLDVHGELTAEDRSVWDRHLADCEDCRREKERLCALVRNAKEGGAVAPLSSEEEQHLSASIQRTLRIEKPDAAFKRLGWRIAPALGACLIIVFAGWFSLKDFRSPDTVSINGSIQEEIIINNEELLKNMELLEEMEMLEELVNLLDKQNLDTSLLESEGSANNVRAHV